MSKADARAMSGSCRVLGASELSGISFVACRVEWSALSLLLLLNVEEAIKQLCGRSR